MDLTHRNPAGTMDAETRVADIGYIAGRLRGDLAMSRLSYGSEQVRLHAVCRTAVQTIIELTESRPRSVPFDVSDGLGELRDVLLGIITSEYEAILDPEPEHGFVRALAMATGGLMMRGANGLISDSRIDYEVDAQLSAFMRCVA